MAVLVDKLGDTFSTSEMVVIGCGEDGDVYHKPGKPSTHYVASDAGAEGRGQSVLRWRNAGKVTKAITELARREQCTCILVTFPNEVYMYAAYRASKKLQIPLYTWFHNTYLDNRKGPLKWLAKYLQPRFFRHATVNFTMSDGMLDFFKEKYPQYTFATLEHGFDIPQVSYEPYQTKGEKIKLMYSGNISASCLDATLRLFEIVRETPEYELHIYGKTSAFEEFNIDTEGFILHGFVPWDEFIGSFSKYDVMLLPHGLDGDRTEAEYKTIFPTRTVPLLYSNRPILAHTPKNVFFTDFLRKHDCAEIVDEKDKDAIHAAIRRLVSDDQRRGQLVKNAIKTAGLFDVNSVSKKLKEIIFEQS